MTPQRRTELIQKTITHFETQGARGAIGSTCRYRTPDGLKCGVGAHIVPEAYNNAIEGTSLVYQGENNSAPGKALLGALKRSGINVDDNDEIGLLRLIQQFHDKAKDVGTLLVSLRAQLTV